MRVALRRRIRSHSGMSFPIRSPREQALGIFILPRVIDKIRLNAAGKLPAGYHLGILAKNRTFDDRLCKFLEIDFEELTARVLQGGADDEIMEWCFENGRKPTAEQIEIWNAFMEKRGWRDAAGLDKSKVDAGLAHRPEILTYFDLMEVEEGHVQ
jgi:gluconokinase